MWVGVSDKKGINRYHNRKAVEVSSKKRTSQGPADPNRSRKMSHIRGVSRIFERGGPISLGSLKKGHQIKRGGPMV